MQKSNFKKTREPKRKIVFKNQEHENRYKILMSKVDEFYRSSSEIQEMMYLIALIETECPGVAEEIFDFSWRMIKPDVLEASWQTEKTKRALLLAFNLWNGYQTSLYHIFGHVNWDRYLLEAIYIRYHFTCDFEDNDFWERLMKQVQEKKEINN